MANYILVMDQGTTGSRGVVYDEKGKTVAIDYEEYEQFFPNSGWWEQSGKTVWEVTLRTSRNAIKKAGLTGKTSRQSVLPTRERPQQSGIRQQENRFTTRLSGAAAVRQISVRN